MPITNDQMKPNRFLRWHRARKTLAAIKAHLATGGIVQVTTHTRATRYTAKHADLFVAGKDGLYVRRGKALDYLFGGCKITLH